MKKNFIAMKVDFNKEFLEGFLCSRYFAVCDTKLIGEHMFEFRKSLGLTKQDVKEMSNCDLSISQMSLVETGRCSDRFTIRNYGFALFDSYHVQRIKF